MKNIHILPTDKPSRLYYNKNGKNYDYSNTILSQGGWVENQNIYITSDEVIKKGKWCYHPLLKGGCIIQSKYDEPNSTMKKIILTTDLDLIKDGVQSIPDEFLEWFVKNPSCEEVEITTYHVKGDISGKLHYKIIIPKEEPKQDWYCSKCQSYISSESVIFEETHQLCNTSVIILEPKQETLEEAAERTEFKRYGETLTNYTKQRPAYNLGFNNGAKWQQERSYNEEDIIEASKYGYNFHKTTQFPQQEFEDSCIRNTQQWLEQFKKK